MPDRRSPSSCPGAPPGSLRRSLTQGNIHCAEPVYGWFTRVVGGGDGAPCRCRLWPMAPGAAAIGVRMPPEDPGAGRAGQRPLRGESRRPFWVSGGVASVGAASFFSDAGHEIATAVLPSFLTSVLRGSAGVLGVIEGLSDALLGVATLVASLAPQDAYGRAFGVERAGDNLGAVAGPLLAALLVAVVGIRHSFYFALLPGVGAALAISVAAARAPRVATAGRGPARLELGGLRRAGLLGPLLPVAMFELGNVTTTLLILRATGLLHHGGRSLTAAASLAILIYAAHNLVATVTALLGGGWVDRGGPQRGPRRVFATGAAVYVVAYGGFALGVRAWPALLVVFCMAGDRKST